MLIDVQGSFQARLFNEKVKQAYNRHELWKCLGGNPTEKQKTNDKHRFIKQVMQSLTVFKCMDGNEFNLAVRSLAVWFKRHKGVGLVVLDGMQFVENADFLSQYERKQNKAQHN